jgi:hypothetical protein
MDADEPKFAPDLKNPKDTRYLLKEETHRIIGFAFEVLNELGHGLYEKIYENALVVDFQLNGIPYSQQRKFDVLYKKHPVGFYVPDLIAFDQWEDDQLLEDHGAAGWIDCELQASATAI